MKDKIKKLTQRIIVIITLISIIIFIGVSTWVFGYLGCKAITWIIGLIYKIITYFIQKKKDVVI